MANLTRSYWPATDEYPLLDTTCGGVLRAQAERQPGELALREAHPDPAQRRGWTYGELLAASERLAAALLTRFDPGTHIAVWGGNRPEWIVTQFGIALAGMVMVTVNPAYRAAELAFLLRQSRSRGIFYQPCYRDTAMRAVIDEATRLEPGELELLLSFDELDAFIAAAAPTRLPDVRPADRAMIQYTSGTTGLPKGAVLTHHGITNNSRIMGLLKGQNDATVNLAVPPLFHTGGCVGGVLASVQTGGTFLLPEHFDAEFMLDLIEQERATYTFAVPTMLIAMLEAQRRRPRNLDSLQTVFTGGTIVPIELVRRVEAEFEVCLIIGYGQTETSPAITHTRLTDSAEQKSETIGYPIPCIEVQIVDPASGEVLPIGASGELCTRGFHVMQCYYDLPEATAQTIDSGGWLHTGDLCTMDSGGYCRITGRLKDMIIRGGENVYPREIEEVLHAHPQIAEAAVVGIPDDYWGEQIACVITRPRQTPLDSAALKTFVSEKLARHKVPRLWFEAAALPMTVSGKVQKFRLVEQIIAGELDGLKF